jgi:hypothetical protein
MALGLRERRLAVGVVGTVVSWACVSSLALAEPGEHIKLGESAVLEPSVGVGVEFRSNAFLSVGAAQSDAPADAAVPAFNFLFTPALALRVTTPKVNFDLDGRYELRKYFEEDVASRLDRFTDFNIGSRLDILPKGVVGLVVREKAVLRNRASDNRFFDNALLSQFRNDLGAELMIRPGPEFDIGLGVDWGYHNYRVPRADGPEGLNNRNTAAPRLDINWRFFPRTAFVVEATYLAHRWQTNWIPTNQSGSGGRTYGQFLAMPDSDHVKVMSGIRGRLTPYLVLVATVGYGGGFYNDASVVDEAEADGTAGNESDPETAGFGADVSATDGILVMLRSEFDFGFTDKRTFGQQFTLMYRKDFQDSFFTNYVHQHHFLAQLESRFGRHFGTQVAGSVRIENYEGEVTRRDIFLGVDGDFLITPLPWMGIDLGVSWVQRASSQTEIQYDNVTARLMLEFSY